MQYRYELRFSRHFGQIKRKATVTAVLLCRMCSREFGWLGFPVHRGKWLLAWLRSWKCRWLLTRRKGFIIRVRFSKVRNLNDNVTTFKFWMNSINHWSCDDTAMSDASNANCNDSSNCHGHQPVGASSRLLLADDRDSYKAKLSHLKGRFCRT